MNLNIESHDENKTKSKSASFDDEIQSYELLCKSPPTAAKCKRNFSENQD